MTTKNELPIYLVVWSGGYEAPQYSAYTEAEKAMAVALEWAEDMEEGVDTIDVLRIDQNLAVERVELAHL